MSSTRRLGSGFLFGGATSPRHGMESQEGEGGTCLGWVILLIFLLLFFLGGEGCVFLFFFGGGGGGRGVWLMLHCALSDWRGNQWLPLRSVQLYIALVLV